MKNDTISDVRYCESLRKRAADEKASADHRLLIIGDLTRKLEVSNKKIIELEAELEHLKMRVILKK